MPTTRHHLLLLLVPLHLAAPMSPAMPPTADANATAHDLLPLFGLPMGLLPANVVSYTMSDEGDFTVELSEPCYIQFSDLAYFEKTIRGKITYGLISGLSGIQVRKFFIWVGIIRVAASKDDGTIVFSTWLLSEKHPTSEFLDVRPCKKRAAGPSSSSRQGDRPVGVAAA